jgi:hypothetical protein
MAVAVFLVQAGILLWHNRTNVLGDGHLGRVTQICAALLRLFPQKENYEEIK